MDEPNAPPPRRRFFQLHLSTCVVLMVVAGGMGMLNCMEGSVDPNELYHLKQDRDYPSWKAFGWPYYCYLVPPDQELWSEGTFGVMPGPFAADVLIGFSLIWFAGRACEWAIRRRTEKRASAEQEP
ncbi:MAG: hypothetical protein L6R28_13535 [Planctomycetes bacterium]|nr:hypothetical protein [Planctomycetota bacterium]